MKCAKCGTEVPDDQPCCPNCATAGSASARQYGNEPPVPPRFLRCAETTTPAAAASACCSSAGWGCCSVSSVPTMWRWSATSAAPAGPPEDHATFRPGSAAALFCWCCFCSGCCSRSCSLQEELRGRQLAPAGECGNRDLEQILLLPVELRGDVEKFPERGGEIQSV